MNASPQTGVLLEHLFRRQSGRMVAYLTRLLGAARLDLAETAVQEAMLQALQTWPYQGAPENPAAWLFRVARNAAIDLIRRERMMASKADSVAAELWRNDSSLANDPDFEERLGDDELSMIFMCCRPEISRDSSVALSLKTVGGFSVREIASAFLADETAIAQRLVRAKRQIREHCLTLEMPRETELQERLDAVLEVIYFIFNEGYAAHEGEALIRQDLCFEALRLGNLLSASPVAAPRVHALMAVMALQAARLPARTDEAGDLILLENQDRSRWDRKLIAAGFRHFSLSVAGEEVSAYHVQAAIAATHARAENGDVVDWAQILDMYNQLFAMNPSPVVALNRAVAISKARGAAEALAALEPLTSEAKLQNYHLLLAVRGHLLLDLRRGAEAADCYRAALQLRCSEPERRFLQRKLGECTAKPDCDPNLAAVQS